MNDRKKQRLWCVYKLCVRFINPCISFLVLSLVIREYHTDMFNISVYFYLCAAHSELGFWGDLTVSSCVLQFTPA